jgi:hypothetical protein
MGKQTVRVDDLQSLLEAELGSASNVHVSQRADTLREPHVVNNDRDLLGVALSGGGIRSATFNLGVLQALAKLKLLPKVDYLSTVSGGGYVGGWWSRYLVKAEQSDEKDASRWFPQPKDGEAEAAAITHLRRFSNFLSPRIGVLESETWAFMTAVLSAMLPSLLATTAFVVVLLNAFLGFVFLTAQWHVFWAIAMTVTVHVISEIRWRGRNKADDDAKRPVAYILLSLAAALISAVLIFEYGPAFKAFGYLNRALSEILPKTRSATFFSPVAYVPAAIFAMPGVLMLALRWVFSPFVGTYGMRTIRAAYDRGLSRFLVLGVGYAALVLLLQVAYALSHFPNLGTWIVPASAAGSSTLFAWLMHKFSKDLTRKVTGWMEGVFKRNVPQMLAMAAVLLAFLGVAVLVIWEWRGEAGAYSKDGWVLLCASIGLILLVLFFFDPNRVGLHAAYRSRLARAYLGGGTAGPIETTSDERSSDDISMACLSMKPLHLVCCTVNNLAGDGLDDFSRGGRSGVLSRHGIAIGNNWRKWKDGEEGVSLSSAMTASAAAFNSNMGSISKQMGPAAGFVLSALNLRLGLWTRSAIARGDSWRETLLRGSLFFAELLGNTKSDGEWVHLSDGGHFENLAIYELVRRRCRYIIVSDCGQDGEYAFDDLGNAIRRIRADFGIDIEIDVRALKPGENGFAERSVAVGRILYGPGEEGTLVYLKPTFTGGEPGDVTQYRARNPEFPHQSTGDQFYDEPQWESYRRLGMHIATTALDIATRNGDTDRRDEIAWWFSEISSRWYPTPPDLEEKFLQLTERCAQVERDIHETAPRGFVQELFPELATLAGRPAAYTPADWYTTLHLCLLMAQVMEDVFVGAQLEPLFNHPLNVGWINYFNRWTSSPTFRTFWPILRPIWGPGLRHLLETLFGLKEVVEQAEQLDKPIQIPLEGPANLPAELLRLAKAEGHIDLKPGEWVYVYALHLRRGDERHILPSALAVVDGHDDKHLQLQHLFVPRGLWGAGIGVRFIDRLCARLASAPEGEPGNHASTLSVLLPSRRNGWNPARFYRSAGFEKVGPRMLRRFRST